jgi:hypothetical protein
MMQVACSTKQMLEHVISMGMMYIMAVARIEGEYRALQEERSKLCVVVRIHGVPGYEI